jgi:hypothetical protein
MGLNVPVSMVHTLTSGASVRKDVKVQDLPTKLLRLMNYCYWSDMPLDNRFEGTWLSSLE